MRKVRFGVLGTARIAVDKVIPALQQCRRCEVVAIASRSLDRAQDAASSLGISRAHGSYEALLDDAHVDAVYNPLPNHLHVPWSVRAIALGKHVLCEKPIGLSVAEAQELIAAARQCPHLKVMEAFMYRHHPQWIQTRDWVQQGAIGTLRTIHSFFSYHNERADDIRNQAAWGGGGLMDIGCYPVSLSRFLFQGNPTRIAAWVEIDDRFGVDRLAAAILEFDKGIATFTCSTQLVPYQRVHVYGTAGRIELEIPFNAPPDRPCTVWLENANGLQTVSIPTCDQYTIQGDLFADAILDDKPVPTPLQDALDNMRVIEQIRQAAQTR